jgi:hypothetical protein
MTWGVFLIGDTPCNNEPAMGFVQRPGLFHPKRKAIQNKPITDELENSIRVEGNFAPTDQMLLKIKRRAKICAAS